MLLALASRRSWKRVCNWPQIASSSRRRSAAVAVADREIKDLALAEFRPLGRRQLDVLAQIGDGLRIGPRDALFRSAGGPHLGQRRLQHPAAPHQLDDRLLYGLHFLGMVELARPFLAVVSGLVADDRQCLRGFPGGWPIDRRTRLAKAVIATAGINQRLGYASNKYDESRQGRFGSDVEIMAAVSHNGGKIRSMT